MDPRARDLMDANADWWKSDAHREDREVVLAVDRAVAADGFTPNTDDYYIEMVRRARQRGLGDLIQLPTWMSEDDLVDEDVQRRNRKPKGRRPVNRGPGGMGEGGGDRGEMTRLKREASGKVQLTPRDFRRMEQFRLDPKNPKHLQEYARGKAEQARQELSTRG
jgi:hypothetical protein